ncbi:MAG: PKD domain-containing protein, partial [Sphingobacteriia bacterium]
SQVGSTPTAATIASPGTASTNVSGLTGTGTYTFRWTVTPTSGTCPAAASNVTITRGAAPVVDAGPFPADPICGATSYQLTPSPAGGTWSIVSQPVGASTVVSATTNLASGMTVAGTYVLAYTLPASGGCPASSDQITLSVNPPVTANAGADQPSVCGTTTVTLTANNPAPNGTGAWTLVSGPSSVSITSPNSPTTTVTGLTSTASPYTFRWTVTPSISSCPIVSDNVVITRVNSPVVVLGPDISNVCSSTVNLDLGSSSTLGTWRRKSGPAGVTFVATASPTITRADNLVAPAVYVFEYVLPGQNGCPEARDEIQVTTVAPPTADAGPATALLCGTDFITLSPTATGGTGAWSFVSTTTTPPITPVITGNTVSGLSGAGTYTLRYTVTSAACGTTASDAIVITRAANPTADAGDGASNICETSFTLTPTATAGDGQWSVANQPNGASVTFSGNVATGMTVGGTYVFRYTVASPAGCTDEDQVTITKDPSRPVFSFSPRSLLIPDATELTFRNETPNAGGSVFVWTFVGGTPNRYVGATPPRISYSEPGTYPVRLEMISAAGCASSTEQQVTVDYRIQVPIPTAFSPNGDGLNDEFQFVGLSGVRSVRFLIYDRWGNEVFNNGNKRDFTWNGRIDNSGDFVPEGTYVWVMDAEDLEGRKFEQRGTILILR